MSEFNFLFFINKVDVDSDLGIHAAKSFEEEEDEDDVTSLVFDCLTLLLEFLTFDVDDKDVSDDEVDEDDDSDEYDSILQSMARQLSKRSLIISFELAIWTTCKNE